MQIGGHTWEWAASDREGRRLARDLARLIGPAGGAVLQHLMSDDGFGALVQLRDMAREWAASARARLLAQTPVPSPPAPDASEEQRATAEAAIQQALAMLERAKAILPDDLAANLGDVLVSDAFFDWQDEILSACTRDGVRYDPNGAAGVTTREAYEVIAHVCREQAVFR